MSVVGQVKSARKPPEFVSANWTPMELYLVRIASVTTLPTRDSHVRPLLVPHWSARGIYLVEVPITVLRIGASCALSWSIRAWIVGSGVTPMSQGLWKSTVL